MLFDLRFVCGIYQEGGCPLQDGRGRNAAARLRPKQTALYRSTRRQELHGGPRIPAEMTACCLNSLDL